MTRALEDAVAKARTLSPDQQVFVAHVIEALAADATAVVTLSEQERALVREGLADLDAGRIVSDADMAAFWNRHRP